MFYKNLRQVYRVSELDAIDWLVHGFGTRLSESPANLTLLKQVHGAACIFAAGRSGNLGPGDALLDDTPGAVLAVKTADCVPVLLVDARRRAIAAVHAGWRGTVAGIVQRAVEAMCERFGTAPEDLHAAIGPAIGKCCYEVGPDVAKYFGRQGRAHVNLEAANRQQLLTAGLAADRIHAADLCTMCNPAEFHSYRRDREAAGRMYSFIGIVAGSTS